MFDFSLLLMALMVGCGLYCIYLWVRIRREWQLFDNKLMLPGNCTAADCADPDGFLEFMSPKLFAFGIAVFLLGLGYLPEVLNLPLPDLLFRVIDITLTVLSLGAFVAFILIQRKAAKLFW